MKLLIITQKVDENDSVLGFFIGWIKEFARRFDEVTIICLEKGEYRLPPNARVLSLGKEAGRSRLKYVWRFYKYIWRERRHYDAVFVHMNAEYVVLGGLFWKLFGKRIVLWYTHRAVHSTLRLASWLADAVATSTKESFRLSTKKVHYFGHGIDTERFALSSADFAGTITIAHIGRITPIKHIGVFIKAALLLKEKGISVHLRLIGEPLTETDKTYKRELENLGDGLAIEWVGAVPNIEMPLEYQQITLSVNAAPDGGMDKAVLESLAAGRPVFVANRAFEGLFGPLWPVFSYPFGEAAGLADKLRAFIQEPEHKRRENIRALEQKVRKEYDTVVLIEKISHLLSL